MDSKKDNKKEKKVDKKDIELEWRPVDKRVVAFADAVVEATHGIPLNAQIDGDTAWLAVDRIVSLWSQYYPGEAEAYYNATKEIRDTRWDKRHAATKSKNLRYLSLIPSTLYIIIRRVFPAQNWDKEFSRKFVERYRAFKVPDKI